MATRNAVSKEWVPLLAEVPIFAGLSRRHLGQIAGLATQRRLAAHTVILRAGEPGDAFYVVVEGRVNARRPNTRGVEIGPGDFFGEMALLDDGPRSAIVEATTEVLVLRIGRANFLKMLKKDASVSTQMLRTLAARLRETNDRIYD